MEIGRLALKIVVIARQEARVKKFAATLRFFTQFGFIVFTYLENSTKKIIQSRGMGILPVLVLLAGKMPAPQ